jgi:uncharacterized protein
VKQTPYKLPKKALNLTSIDLDLLKKCDIQGIILDLDNTLVSEDDYYLSPGGEDWIKQAQLNNFKFFILSNGKRRYRVEYWSYRLGIPAVNPARKPFPFGFRKASAYMQLKSKQIVVIGDSLHTDVVGAWISGHFCIQVASLPHPPRWWERLLGRWVQTPYPFKDELWRFDSSQY